MSVKISSAHASKIIPAGLTEGGEYGAEGYAGLSLRVRATAGATA